MECPICLCDVPSDEQMQFVCKHKVCMNCCMKMISILPRDSEECRCPLCRTEDKIPVDIYHCVMNECFERTTMINNEEDIKIRRIHFKEYMNFILEHKWILSCVKDMKRLVVKKCKQINDDDSLLLAAKFDSIEI